MVSNLPLHHESVGGDWVMVEEGGLKGVTLMVHGGDAISLSTGSCRDADRWETLPTKELSKYPSLEVLDLHKSRYLEEFNAEDCPLPELNRLLLTSCLKMVSVAPSIGRLQNLVELNFFDSPNIGSLPEEIGQLKSLKKLIFGGSSGIANKTLTALPDSLGQLTNLEELVLDKLKTLRLLPDSIGNCTKLNRLILSDCKRLEALPESVGNCTQLIEVSCSKCINLQRLPENIGELSQLEDLILTKCKIMTDLPESIGNCKNLCYLSLRSCVALTMLPASLGDLPRLRSLDLAMCDNLKMVPTWLVGDAWRMEPIDLSHRITAAAAAAAAAAAKSNDEMEE